MTTGAGKPGEATPPPAPALGQMLDGYFHQDYRYIYVTPVGAARAFAVEASEKEVRDARGELESFIAWAVGVRKARWQEALGTLGGAWMPSTLEPLRTVLRALGPATPVEVEGTP